MFEWWYWVVLGVLLIVAEIFMLGFSMIWFGISAVFVGVISFFINFSLSYQIIFWAIGSVSLLWIWFNYLKGGSQNQHLSQSGEYKDILGEITQVIDNSRYRATFNVSILGDRNWIVESNQELKVGDKVLVDEVCGQLLRVRRVD